jgi:hypothetical protein
VNTIADAMKAKSRKNESTAVQGSHTFQALTADVIDVYKSTNALIVLMDPVKRSSWDFAMREIENAPKQLDILLVVSDCILGASNAVF